MGKPRRCNDSSARSQRLAISSSLLKSTRLIPRICRANSSALSTYRNGRKVLTCFRPIFARLLRASAPAAGRARGNSSPIDRFTRLSLQLTPHNLVLSYHIGLEREIRSRSRCSPTSGRGAERVERSQEGREPKGLVEIRPPD